MSFERDLIDALDHVEEGFHTDELAYLALTQKVEQAFRDKLAYKLHRRFEGRGPELLVCREWQRADLALVTKDGPRLLLEAKAGYTFDIMMRNKGFDFAKLCASDLRKAAALAVKMNCTPEIYALAIATHPHAAPAPEYRTAVKYYPGVRKYATAANNHDAVKAVMRETMTDFEEVHHLPVAAGQAFGAKVSLFVWLYRAKRIEAEATGVPLRT